MPKISIDDLSASTQKKVAVLQMSANLPRSLPWPEGVTVENLANTGSHVDRFNDGKFQVTLSSGQTWTCDGGVSVEAANVGWIITLETETGEITATPVIHTRINDRKVRDGDVSIPFPTRVIGTLGKLLPLIPTAFIDALKGTSAPDLKDEFDLESVYAEEPVITPARELLVMALNASLFKK